MREQRLPSHLNYRLQWRNHIKQSSLRFKYLFKGIYFLSYFAFLRLYLLNNNEVDDDGKF